MARARRRAAAARDAGGEGLDADIGTAGEAWAQYEPWTVDLTTHTVLYTDLAVVDDVGCALCRAIPVFERDHGVLTALPGHHRGCLPGPTMVMTIPAAEDDDPEMAVAGVRVSVALPSST